MALFHSQMRRHMIIIVIEITRFHLSNLLMGENSNRKQKIERYTILTCIKAILNKTKEITLIGSNGEQTFLHVPHCIDLM